MKSLQFSLIFLCITLCLVQSFSQEITTDNNSSKIEAILKVKDGNIHLRWAPSSPGLWLQMQRGSVIVQKQSWEKGKFDVDLPLVTISDTIRVWAQSEFEQLSPEEQTNEYLMLAGYCMHAPYESIREKGLSLQNIVNREEELTNRFSSVLFASDRDKLAAKASAFSHVDENVDLNKNHAYHIIMLTEENKVYQAYAFYDVNKSYEFKPSISKTSEEEGLIVLSWDKASHAAHYSAYWIERSLDNSHFEKLNSAPYVHAFDANLPDQNDDFIYIDSVTNYQSYYYRIVGLDAFGDESEPSPSCKLMGRDKTPPSTVNAGKAEMYLDQYMEIAWLQNDPSMDLSGYYIKKSNLREGPFEIISPLLDAQQKRFKDFNPNYIGTNFYQICAVDTAQNQACSYPIYGLLKDTIPPLKPIGLEGQIDSSGVVNLTWKVGKELDLQGYNVYFANKWNRVFTILNESPVLTNQFVDTVNLNSLTEDIYYRIVAMDVRNNLSTFSDMVQLFKPDTIPPGPSVFINFTSANGKITLHWAPSSSKDVVNQNLFRSVNGKEFALLHQFNKTTNEYVDSDLKPNEKYNYRIIALDDSGLSSKSVKDLSILSPIQEKKIRVTLKTNEEEEGKYILSCSLNNEDSYDGKLIIYTKDGDGPFITWNSIKITKRELKIPISNDSNRKYKARFVQGSGQKSDFSEIVSL